MDAAAVIRFIWKKVIFELEFSFFLIAAWIGAADGIRAFGVLFSACLLHECGHWIVLRILHRRVRCVRISGVGVLIQPVSGYGSYGGDIAVLLAGPLVNLLLGSFALWRGDSAIAVVHLGLGLFNLLPYAQLDGGAVLLKVLELWELRVETAAKMIRFVSLGTTLVLIGIGLGTRLHNLSYYGLLIYLTAATFLPEEFQRKTRV